MSCQTGRIPYVTLTLLKTFRTKRVPFDTPAVPIPCHFKREASDLTGRPCPNNFKQKAPHLTRRCAQPISFQTRSMISKVQEPIGLRPIGT